MTTRFVIPMIAALGCVAFMTACNPASAPSKACVEAARLYAEALDSNTRAPEGEKVTDSAIRKQALETLEERKDKECPQE